MLQSVGTESDYSASIRKDSRKNRSNLNNGASSATNSLLIIQNKSNSISKQNSLNNSIKKNSTITTVSTKSQNIKSSSRSNQKSLLIDLFRFFKHTKHLFKAGFGIKTQICTENLFFLVLIESPRP